MKRLLLISGIILGMIFAGHSTTPCTDSIPSKDTLCFPVEVVRLRFMQAEQFLLLSKYVDTLNKEIRFLDSEINSYKHQVVEYEKRGSIDSLHISLLEANFNDTQDQRKAMQDAINALNKAVKIANTKTYVVGGVLLTLTVLTLLNLLKK